MHLILMHSASCPCLLLIGLQVLPFPAVLLLSRGPPHAISELAQQRPRQILHGVQLQLSAGIAKAQVMLECSSVKARHHRHGTINACAGLYAQALMHDNTIRQDFAEL